MLIEKPQKLPLEMAELKLILESKSKDKESAPELTHEPMMVVSYKNSTVKGKFFINYISNLKLSVLLDGTGVSKEERLDLLKEYMTAASVTEIENLNETAAALMLEQKGETVNVDMWLSQDERKEFIETNKDIVSKWERFLDSILVGLPFCNEAYSQSVGKELIDSEMLELITDVNYIGRNVALLIATEGYIESYLSYPVKTKPAFFETQWFEPVFSGHSLMNIMSNGSSSLFPFMVSCIENWFPEEELKQALGIAA